MSSCSEVRRVFDITQSRASCLAQHPPNWHCQGASISLSGSTRLDRLELRSGLLILREDGLCKIEGHMPRLIERPTIVQAAGNKPKQILEFAGRVNSGHSGVSVARMVSPGGWLEPGQRPQFEEITVVLRGMVRVEHDGGVLDVRAGQAVVTSPGEWIRYSTPEADGAEYVAICLPAFSPDTVHRDPE